MPITDYYTWDWNKLHLLTSQSRDLIRRYFAPFNDAGELYDPDTLASIIVEFSQFFFGDAHQAAHYHIRTAVPEFHRQVYRDLAQEKRFYYITCPSEFGKTTIATLIYPIYRALYKLDAYITVGGSTQDLSQEEHFDNIKRELMENEKLIAIFGAQRTERRNTQNTRYKPWSTSEIELPSGVVMRALGCMGRIRGRKTGAIRPTLVIIDDPEEAEDVDSEALLARHRKWLFRNVMYRIDNDYGKIRLIGNMLSDNCLLAHVKRDQAWSGVDYSALDSNDRSIWEERWPTSYLIKERQNAIDSGRYEEWMFERMNRPVYRKSRRINYKVVDMEFTRSMEQNLLSINGMEPIVVSTWLGIDPEIDAEDWGARAFITIAKAYFEVEGKLRICTFALDYLFRPLDPSDIVEAIAENHERYYYSGVAIESNAWQQIFHRDIEDYQATSEFYNAHPFRFIPIRDVRRKKVARILRLQNPAKQGRLFVNSNMKELTDEMDYFGAMGEKGLHLLDALEMGDRYALPPEEVRRTYPGEDIRVKMRLHKPWADVARQPARANIDAHDAWRRFKVPSVK